MSDRFCVDANVLITAWHVTYPPRIFSRLWDMIAENRARIVLLRPVFDEIEPVSSSDMTLPATELHKRFPL